jgi:hypothetical protein
MSLKEINYLSEKIDNLYIEFEIVKGGFSACRSGLNNKYIQIQDNVEELEDFNKRQILWNQDINNRIKELEDKFNYVLIKICELEKERDKGIERIKALEKLSFGGHALDRCAADVLERLDKLELFHKEWKEMPKWDLKLFFDKAEDLEDKVKSLTNYFDMLSVSNEVIIKDKKPHT